MLSAVFSVLVHSVTLVPGYSAGTKVCADMFLVIETNIAWVIQCTEPFEQIEYFDCAAAPLKLDQGSSKSSLDITIIERFFLR